MATKKSKTKKLKFSSLRKNPLVKSGFARNLLFVFLIGAGSFLLAKKYRGQFIVATVNYQPISRIKLNKLLNERYGQLVLDELINQTLIEDLLKQNNISVSKEEIEEEVDALKTQLGGDQAFQAAIAQYGLTTDQLKDRLKITIGQKKLSQSLFKPEVTAEEVAQYYEQNKAVFQSTPLSEVEEKIKDNLLNQKLQQQFNDWFAEQKDNASIRLFI